MIFIGADIHPYMEIKINGVWTFIDPVTGDRNYELFGFLSGVRGRDEPYHAFEHRSGRNPPEDASSMLKRYWTEDEYEHSHTVVYYDALKKFIEEYPEESSYTKDWLKMMEFFGDEGIAQDARVLLWYDN